MADQFGPYRLDKLLGRGGMGEVYLAYDAAHQRMVALKLLLESLSAEPDYRARFEREARIAAGLREHHIIPIHTVRRDRQPAVHRHAPRRGRRPGGSPRARTCARPRRAVGILRQIASALDAAHAGRAWSTATSSPRTCSSPGAAADGPDAVYLADFGIVREDDAARGSPRPAWRWAPRPTWHPNGSPVPPVDHRVDIYALGCILVRDADGTTRRSRVPTTAALLFQHLNSQPARP